MTKVDPRELEAREAIAVAAHKEVFALLNPSGCGDNVALDAMVVIEKAMQQLGWYLNYETEEWEQRQPCDHKWIDATNEVISGTAYCSKCGKLESLAKVQGRE